MIKMVFMLHRKDGLTREQCLTEWTGEQHLARLDEMHAAGLHRYVQNKATGDTPDGAPDGVGEMWFADAEAMDRVMKCEAWVAGFEDAKRFLDLDRTFGFVVEELVRIE